MNRSVSGPNCGSEWTPDAAGLMRTPTPTPVQTSHSPNAQPDHAARPSATQQEHAQSRQLQSVRLKGVAKWLVEAESAVKVKLEQMEKLVAERERLQKRLFFMQTVLPQFEKQLGELGLHRSRSGGGSSTSVSASADRTGGAGATVGDNDADMAQSGSPTLSGLADLFDALADTEAQQAGVLGRDVLMGGAMWGASPDNATDANSCGATPPGPGPMSPPAAGDLAAGSSEGPYRTDEEAIQEFKDLW
jgi:hypothetical protein